jgi:hypothetical protein
MHIRDVRELQYIAPIENVPSILDLGILSHRLAAEIPHRDTSLAEVQERRSRIHWPGHRPLHEYVCLYLNARNATLYRMKQESRGVCVLGISTKTLDLPGVMLTTGNAGSPHSKQVRWNEGQALQFLDREEIFANSWKDEDGNDLKRIKRIMCAES